MAYCTKCKKEIDALATECLHCTFSFPDEKIPADKFKHKFVRHTIVALFLFSVFCYHIFSARYDFRHLGEIILTILLIPIYIPCGMLFLSTSHGPIRIADSIYGFELITYFIIAGMIGSYLYSWIILSMDNKSLYSGTGKYFPPKYVIKLFVICFLIIFTTSFIGFKPKYYDRGMDRLSCINTLRQIGLSLRMYSNNNDEHFPPYDGAKGLNILKRTGYLDNDRVYLCPTVIINNKFKEKRKIEKDLLLTDYEYCGNLTESDPNDTPLAWDKETNHKNYRNVLFVDGYVKGVSESEWKEKVMPKIIRRELESTKPRYILE